MYQPIHLQAARAGRQGAVHRGEETDGPERAHPRRAAGAPLRGDRAAATAAERGDDVSRMLWPLLSVGLVQLVKRIESLHH